MISALLEKYQVSGVEKITDPQVFRRPPFDGMGRIVGVQCHFSDVEGPRQAMREVQRRLYA